MKILLIQLKRAGDVILTTPIAALLKRRWPQAQVDFLVDPAFAPLLENNPYIDAVRVYYRLKPWKTLRDIQAQAYDQIYDFQSSPRSALMSLLSRSQNTAGYNVPFWGRVYRRTVSRPGGNISVIQGKTTLLDPAVSPLDDLPHPLIFLTEDEKHWAKSLKNGSKGRRLVGLIPTHRRPSRRWHAESFAELARRLGRSGCAVHLFWGPGERPYTERIHRQAPETELIPSTALRQMAVLLAQCDLVVTNDNGPMHIAAAVGAPTLTIYGPTDPRAWNPGGPRHQVIQAEGVSCLGCNLNTCPFGHECMTHLAPERVFAACQDLLARASKAVPV